MALEYTTAPQVSIGEPIDSRHWNRLADSFNSRFLGGCGDPTFRTHFYFHSLFRGFRNPRDAFNFAAEDEWWKFYSHIEPLEYDYPQTSAGLPEGIRVSNPLGGFVFGNENANLYNEPDRINYDGSTGEGVLLHDALGAPVSDADHWEIGKYQRGVTDSAGTDLDQANAIVAAQHHLKIRFGGFEHKGYGGFLPSSSAIGLCEDGVVENYNIKFRKLSTQADCIYSSCPEGSGSGSCPNVSKGVYSWGISGKNYVLNHWDNTQTLLPLEDYIEGPYDGLNDNAFLRRQDGDQLSRTLNFYVNEFRGSDTNRALSDYFVEDYAFDFQRFFTRQYYLAPAYGVASGYGDGSLDAVYTQFDFNSDTAAGYGTTGGSDNYNIHSGFVCAGFIAIGDTLSESKTFTISVDGKDLASVTIDATTTNKSSWFEFPKNGNVKIRCDKAMGASESAYCEISEILEMMPANEDAYIVLRMGSANTTADDGDGHDTASPKNISDALYRHGMIYNGARSAVRSEDTYINRNPIYMTARKVAHDRLRMVERASLKGYEVSGGKSILYYDRKARGVSGADIFGGIAPSETAIASGNIKHNQKYVVSLGTSGITYNGSTVAVGATFTGAKGEKTFTTTSGDEVVKEFDGIIETAGEAGFDNRWCMYMSTTTYKPAEGSAFKPNSYGDIMGHGVDRCTFYSQTWTDITSAEGKEMLQHVTLNGGKPLVRPENPSGYRYALGTHTPPAGTSGTLVADSNTGSCDAGGGIPSTESDCQGVVDHYKSCQIYVPDYQVESVTITASGLVKVTMAGRLRRNDSAPSTVTNTSAGWDSYLSTESGPRSDENAVIEYLRWDQGSGTNCTPRVGDTAPDAPNTGGANWTGFMYGSCLPRFYFTRLIPKVYEDNNNIYQTQDTRLITDELAYLDLVLRAICEGFVDETSTNQLRRYLNNISGKYECYNKRLFDFTYENLFNAANSNRWPRLVPLSERSDNPKMFGPLPMVYTYAEHFNQIARAVNLLNKARLYLPVEVEWRRHDYEGFLPINSVSGDGDCVNGAVWAEDMPTPSATTLISTGAWQTETNSIVLNAYKRAKIDDLNGQCVIKTERRDIEYKIGFSHVADNALPDELKALVINNQGSGFAAAVDDDDTRHERVITTEGNGWGARNPSAPPTANGDEDDYKDDAGNYQDWEPQNTFTTTCETITSGVLEAEEPRRSDFVDTEDGGFGEGSDRRKNLSINNIEAFVRVPLV